MQSRRVTLVKSNINNFVFEQEAARNQQPSATWDSTAQGKSFQD